MEYVNVKGALQKVKRLFGMDNGNVKYSYIHYVWTIAVPRSGNIHIDKC